MVNENSHEPHSFEKGTVDGREVRQRLSMVPSNQPTHVQIGHNTKSHSTLKEDQKVSANSRAVLNRSFDVGKFRNMRANFSKPQDEIKSATGRVVEVKPAAGSANLMSPQEALQDTLGANKRIRADMLSKFLIPRNRRVTRIV